MALTTEEFLAWVSDPNAYPVLLVEVNIANGSTPLTLYLSNRPYYTDTTDTPANTAYNPIILPSLDFSEEISLEGDVSISYGDILLDNTDYSLDSWIDYIWENGTVSIYLGDSSFTRDDFTLIFSGVISNFTPRSSTSMSISIRDMLDALNHPIYDATVGTTWSKGIENQNKDIVRPLCFGEVFNISPVLVDDVTLTYMIHDGPIELILEVRDNGVPVQFVPQLSQGTFSLVNSPVGTITCSAQGDSYSIDSSNNLVSTYNNNAARIVQRIIKSFGNDLTRPLSNAIDTTSFNECSSATGPIGIFISDRTNVLEVCNNILASYGYRLISYRYGKIGVTRLVSPTYPSSESITVNDVITGTVSIQEVPEVVSSIALTYCNNYTVQQDTSEGIPAEHRDIYSREYSITTAVDSAIKLQYKHTKNPEPYSTLLIDATSAETEANRRLDIVSQKRIILSMELTSPYILTSLGSIAYITLPRYSLNNGKYGQIISCQVNWFTLRNIVKVLV